MKYPSGIIKDYNNKINYGNRGMTLENEINESNDYYLSNDIAVIYKKPTPITISKVIYAKDSQKIITEAFFKTPSTTDYNGLYKGNYIDFEAKETTSKSSFPLSNIHNHQLKHLRRIIKHNGISFILVRFTSLNETYLLMSDSMFEFIDNNSKKSIPISFFREKGFIIKDGFIPRIDYLKIIDKYIIEEEYYEKIN